MASVLRQLGLQALRSVQPQAQQQTQLALRRGMGGYAKPKVDTSLDHVFGDNSNKLNYNFEPMGMGSLFIRTMIMCGVFFFPVFIMVNDEYKYTAFLDKLAADKAAKSSE
ncbi:hypothetical protein HYH02_002635 [Chlamydomonas schloesseri]|uniref:Uncharacterized protein n=1 Tax=Chlamydomonas schloesseri TaxID=2026947 RepID=A0A836BA63_9CHLO|nr:hypothetical protein HYH02_002635 [Chlamydomonas schloesseri]|eukprot:KAG2452391.1 hypothetical protein HYH02_002635 [Chlamydomonas schloesseri]